MTIVAGSDIWRSSLSNVFAFALARAGEALAEMTGHHVTVSPAAVRWCTAGDIIEDAGGADAVVVGVYLGITGSIKGHALLMLSPSTARRFSGLLLEGLVEPRGDDHGPDEDLIFDEMETSALQEMGNVTVGAVLNELGTYFEQPIHPTVPQAIVELAGAILESVLLDLIVEVDEVLSARTQFTIDGDLVDGTILILPDAPSLDLLVEAIASAPQ